MNTIVQDRVNAKAPGQTQSFSQEQVKSTDKSPIDMQFSEVLARSTLDQKAEREAKKNGDLSAKTDAEFFQNLNEQTEKQRTPKNKLDKDDFLKLFVTQLQNQDPLNPDDGAEMAAKLAQFNSLEEMMNMNTTLSKVVDGQNSSRSLQLVNYIGKEIRTDGGKFKVHQDGKAPELSIDLKGDVTKAQLIIKDQNGKTVLEKELGSLKAGEQKISWADLNKEGLKVQAGTYSYSVNAKDINGQNIPVAIKTKTMITGVDLKNPDGLVHTELGSYKLGDIEDINLNSLPPQSEAATAKPLLPPQMPKAPDLKAAPNHAL